MPQHQHLRISSRPAFGPGFAKGAVEPFLPFSSIILMLSRTHSPKAHVVNISSQHKAAHHFYGIAYVSATGFFVFFLRPRDISDGLS
jgi:hypothetical protein